MHRDRAVRSASVGHSGADAHRESAACLPPAAVLLTDPHAHCASVVLGHDLSHWKQNMTVLMAAHDWTPRHDHCTAPQARTADSAFWLFLSQSCAPELSHDSAAKHVVFELQHAPAHRWTSCCLSGPRARRSSFVFLLPLFQPAAFAASVDGCVLREERCGVCSCTCSVLISCVTAGPV